MSKQESQSAYITRIENENKKLRANAAIGITKYDYERKISILKNTVSRLKDQLSVKLIKSGQKRRQFVVCQSHHILLQFFEDNTGREMCQLEIQRELGDDFTWRPQVAQLLKCGLVADMGVDKKSRNLYKFSSLGKMKGYRLQDVGTTQLYLEDK